MPKPCLRARWIAGTVLSVIVGASTAFAQDARIVSGIVADSSGRTVAYVSLDGGAKYRTVTNAVGEFSFSVPPNVGIEFNVRRIGYLPTRFRVEPGSDTTIRVTIQQLAVLMTTQIVRAQQQIRTLELRGFYERMLEHQRGALVGVFILASASCSRRGKASRCGEPAPATSSPRVTASWVRLDAPPPCFWMVSD